MLEPDAILATLDRHEVRYVLIGGLAAVVHGSPFPTEDVDITPEASSGNLGRLSAALTELEARIRTDAVPGGPPFSHDAESLAAAGIWNLETRHGSLDISMVPTGTLGFPDLSASATATDVWGVTIAVASLADIIRSKQAANRLKDQRVLPVLREILARTRDR